MLQNYWQAPLEESSHCHLWKTVNYIFTDFLTKGSEEGGGRATNPYSFFAKNIYVFHMIFQKFVFDSLEHTDHALNLIADSSFPGILELIDIKKQLESCTDSPIR